MDPRLIAWLVAVSLAIVSLSSLMGGRQTKLMIALRSYVASQLEWSRKRDKAARLAQILAREKAEDEAKQAEMVGEASSDPLFAKYHENQEAA